MGKEAENHSSKEKNRNVDLCKEKKIAFLLEWGKMSLDKDLLMGDPFTLSDKKRIRIILIITDLGEAVFSRLLRGFRVT